MSKYYVAVCRLRHARHRLPIAHDRWRTAHDEQAGDVFNVHEWANRHPPDPIGARAFIVIIGHIRQFIGA
jgi:hypothetical protein